MRVVLIVLLVANLGFFAWTQGWLDGVVGVRADGGREPERLARQVHPELIRTLSPAEVAASGAAKSSTEAQNAEAAAACLQAGPFTPAEIGAAEAALQAALPASGPARYANLKTEQPGTWLVYLGRFASLDAVRQKEEELARIHVDYEELLEPPELAPGLALGRFDSKAGAEAGLARLVQRGLRTGRVTVLTPPGAVHSLRIEHADAALQAQLAALASPAFATRRFEPCAGALPAGAASAASNVAR
jgi:hypothetical protein